MTIKGELSEGGDDLTGRLVAGSPSAASVWGEFADNSTSFAIAMLDLQTQVYAMQRRVSGFNSSGVFRAGT